VVYLNGGSPLFTWRRTKLVILGLLLSLVLVLHLGAISVHSEVKDFAAFYWAGWCAREGAIEHVYDETARIAFIEAQGLTGPSLSPPFVYPPVVAYVLVPFTMVPMGTAAQVWRLLQLAALACALWFALNEVISLEKRLLLVGIGLLSGPALTNQAFAQSTSLQMLLVSLAFVKPIVSRKWLVGMTWGLSAVLKPTSGVLLAAWWRRPWVVLAAAATVLVSLLGPGMESLRRYTIALPRYLAGNAGWTGHSVSLLRVIDSLGLGVWAYLLAGLIVLVVTALAIRGLPQKKRMLAALSTVGVVTPALESHHLLLPLLTLLYMVSTYRQLSPLSKFLVVSALAAHLYPLASTPTPLSSYLRLAGSLCLWVAALSHFPMSERRGSV